MLSICDFEASGGGVKHYCMYLYDSFLEWFTAFGPPYISSGAAVRAMGVRTPPGAAARPRLCVCVFVCRWTGGRERGEDRWLREASEASARGSALWAGTPRE